MSTQESQKHTLEPEKYISCPNCCGLRSTCDVCDGKGVIINPEWVKPEWSKHHKTTGWWAKLSKIPPPENIRSAPLRGAWLEGQMVGYAEAQVQNEVLLKRNAELETEVKENADLLASAPLLREENEKLKADAANSQREYLLTRGMLRDVESENEALVKRVVELEAHNNYLLKVVELRGKDESLQIQVIKTLKRLLIAQGGLRKVIREYNDYSESNDEVPNAWFVEACEAAEKALDECAAPNPDLELDKELKFMESDNKRLRKALEEIAKDKWVRTELVRIATAALKPQ